MDNSRVFNKLQNWIMYIDYVLCLLRINSNRELQIHLRTPLNINCITIVNLNNNFIFRRDKLVAYWFCNLEINT